MPDPQNHIFFEPVPLVGSSYDQFKWFRRIVPFFYALRPRFDYCGSQVYQALGEG